MLDGGVTLRPPATRVNVVVFAKPWLMLNVCVTEASLTHVTWLMAAADGVPMKKVCPRTTTAGADEMVGRGPAKRYGGEKSSVCATLSPPVTRTRASGSSSAAE